MPRFDGTGPQGLGPLTGKGMGQCSSNQPRSQDLNQEATNAVEAPSRPRNRFFGWFGCRGMGFGQRMNQGCGRRGLGRRNNPRNGW